MCSVSGASNAGAVSCARDFMSEYDWCPVFAASNREYLCSRLVLAAVFCFRRFSAALSLLIISASNADIQERNS